MLSLEFPFVFEVKVGVPSGYVFCFFTERGGDERGR